MINEFRKKKLKLRPVTYLCGSNSPPPDVPIGYMWSPQLVPKPKGRVKFDTNLLIVFAVESIFHIMKP